MCGITSDQVIEEARAAKAEGNMPRYAIFTKILMDEFGFTVEQIRQRVGVATPPQISPAVIEAVHGTERMRSRVRRPPITDPHAQPAPA